MANPILGTGLSGLAAAQLGLQTASHNIANADTPGYSRQRILQSAPAPQFTGSGFVGRGTQVATIERVYSEFLEIDARTTRAQQSHLDAYGAQIARIDRLLGDPAAGLTPALESFFSAVHDLAAYPGEAAARQSLVSGAQALAARLRMLDGEFAQARVDVNRQIESAIAETNSIATQIAELNERIVAASANGTSHAPNDLLDRRDALIRDLAGLVRAAVVPEDNGAVNVYVGNGQALVVGYRASRLESLQGLENPQNRDVGIGDNSVVVRYGTADLSGGRIGGLLEFRDRTLDGAHNAIGRIATTLAASFNAQHQLGQDLNGALGGTFFAQSAPQVLPNALNTGGATVAATLVDPAQLSTSDYRLRYDGANYLLTRLADGTTQTFASLPQTVDGVQITLSGAPAANDAFLIQPTRTGARDLAVLVTDSSKVAAAAPIRSAAGVGNAGTATVSAGAVNPPPPANANLIQPVSIVFNDPPTSFNVTGTGTGNPVNVPFTSGAAISYNGWTITIDGAPAAGDAFTVGANLGGRGDNRNALLLAALQTTNLLASGSTTLAGGYGQLVAEVGNRAREIDVAAKAQANLLEATLAEREAVAGVNLDEEAANLLRYQQAYQAAGKAIAIASTLFNTILEIGR